MLQGPNEVYEIDNRAILSSLRYCSTCFSATNADLIMAIDPNGHGRKEGGREGGKGVGEGGKKGGKERPM